MFDNNLAMIQFKALRDAMLSFSIEWAAGREGARTLLNVGEGEVDNIFWTLIRIRS